MLIHLAAQWVVNWPVDRTALFNSICELQALFVCQSTLLTVSIRQHGREPNLDELQKLSELDGSMDFLSDNHYPADAEIAQSGMQKSVSSLLLKLKITCPAMQV